MLYKFTAETEDKKDINKRNIFEEEVEVAENEDIEEELNSWCDEIENTNLEQVIKSKYEICEKKQI